MPAYSIAARPSAGVQTAYTAGLSYYPDSSFSPSPMGDVEQIIGGVIGGAAGGPAGAATGTSVGGLVSNLLGGGSGVDAQRQARVNFVLQAAQRGNVPAAQMIIAGPQNVSGNEAQMWANAGTVLRSSTTGAATYQAAQAAGSYWPVGSGDTAANYPYMRSVIAQWDQQHPTPASIAGVIGVTPSAFLTSGLNGSVMPILLVGGAGIVAFLLLSRRSSR